MLELKAAFATLTVWAVLGISRTVDSALEGVVLLGAAVASLGLLFRAAVKAWKASRRWSKGIDHMLDLPDWQKRTDRKLDEHGRRLDRIDRKLDPDVTVAHVVKQDKPT